jgi:hypothetical protein
MVERDREGNGLSFLNQPGAFFERKIHLTTLTFNDFIYEWINHW